MAALGYFNLTIDYPQNQIYLEPRHETAKSAKYGYRASGLELTKDVQDRFVVLGVIAGSPAEKAGIAAGDEIFSVDGKPAADMALFDYQAAERTEAPISIAIGPEGRRRTVTLTKAVLLP
jgi:C-terminal processing protease CtpA/Prc